MIPPVPHLERLVAHLGWADARVLEAFRNGTTNPTALELFGHLLAAEHVWHARIQGEAPALAVWPSLPLAECEALARENVARLERLVSSLDADAAARPVTYRNSVGAEFTNTVEDILLHLCLHGTYHRGQVAWLQRTNGATPAATDFIAFVRGAPAATRPAAR